MPNNNSIEFLDSNLSSFDNFDDFDNFSKYNDTTLDNNDIFDIGNLKNSNYNKHTINEKYNKQSSEKEKILNDIDITGDKKSSMQIEYTNKEYSEESLYSSEHFVSKFYELDIDDYPNRSITMSSSDIDNKSLGANDTNFISKFLDKIRNFIAR